MTPEPRRPVAGQSYGLQETVTDPFFRCVNRISPVGDTPVIVALAAVSLGEPSTPSPRGGTFAARPPLQPTKAPVFTFEMVVVPVTMTRRETDFLLEPQAERARAATASARSAFTGVLH